MTKKLPVIEIFGPVIQGEGAMAGHQTHFLRLGGCDYRCSWCDTLYAVEPKQVVKNATMMTPEEVAEKLIGMGENTGVRTLTISGGNPVMHNLRPVISHIKKVYGRIHPNSKVGWKFVVETQGTLWSEWLLVTDMVTISPKPPSSGMKTDFLRLRKMFYDLLEEGVPVCVKIVVFDDADYDYALSVFEYLKFRNFASKPNEATFYLQPGTTQTGSEEEVVKDLLLRTKYVTEKMLADPRMVGARVMPQLHSLIYGLRRGV